MKKNKIFQLILSAVLVIAFTVPTLAGTAQSDVVQTVNGVDFTVDQFIEAAKYYRFNLIQQYNYYLTIYQMYGLAIDDEFNQQFADILGESGSEKVREIVLANAAKQVVVAAEAEKAGISVSDEEVEERLKELFGFESALESDAAELPAEEPALEESLDALGAESVSTEPEINKELEFRNKIDEYFDSYVNGAFTLEFFKDDIRAMILEEKLQAYVIGESDEVFEQEEVKARHILVETEEEALAILEKLNAGESWETLAAENSLDTSNKDNSGDLGWFGRGMMVAPFEEAAFALEPGEISDPVESSFGFHIIALDGKELRAMEGSVLEAAQEAAYEKWYEKIAKSYEITTTGAADDIVVTEPVFEPYVPEPTEEPVEEPAEETVEGAEPTAAP